MEPANRTIFFLLFLRWLLVSFNFYVAGVRMSLKQCAAKTKEFLLFFFSASKKRIQRQPPQQRKGILYGSGLIKERQ